MYGTLSICLFFFRTRKRQQATAKSRKQKKTGPTKPTATGWSLDLDSDDERRPSSRSHLVSSLTRRVADGVLRRTIDLKGDSYVELKVYNIKDIEGVDPKNRWERAVVALKYQGDSDSPEFEALKKVVQLCKTKFTAEGTFFADKKKSS